MSLKIKKGDEVLVIAGKDKGKKGKVLQVLPKVNKVLVEGVNRVKKHQKPTQQYREGGIIEKESSIYSWKLKVVCPKCGEPTRVGRKRIESTGKLVRFCKKCGEIIDEI